MARTDALAQYPVLRGLEVIRHLGFDGVEICLENPDLHPDGLDEVLARQIDGRAAALGLAPTSVSYHVDYIYDDALLEQSLKAIALTPAFGTSTFVFGGVTQRTGDEAEWQRMVTRTRRLTRAAEDAGVTLAQEFEPVSWSARPPTSCASCRDPPRLAANSDLGHAFLCDPDPLEAIRQVGDRIVQCHIENMRAGVHAHLVPQEGDMDLAAYLRTLAEVGFDGGLVLDLYGVDLEAVARPALEYLRERTPR